MNECRGTIFCCHWRKSLKVGIQLSKIKFLDVLWEGSYKT